MFREIFELNKESRRKLQSFLSSETFQQDEPDHFKPSKMWTNLKKQTFTAINQNGVLIQSGHNFLRYYPRFKNFVYKSLCKSAFFYRVIQKINLATSYFLNDYNYFNKAESFIFFENLKKCPFAGPEVFQSQTPSLIKALEYNPVSIHGAIENISYISKAIKDNIKISKGLTFFELGAGAGFTTLGLLERYLYPPPARGIICDLPETIAVAYTFISYFESVAKKIKIILPHEVNSESFNKEDWKLLFLTPHQLSLLPESCCDVLINSSSMQEMDKETVYGYFKEIHRLGNPNSFFFCKNHEYARQGYNKFSEYPWHLLGETIYSGIAPYSSSRYPVMMSRIGSSENQKVMVKIVKVKKTDSCVVRLIAS